MYCLKYISTDNWFSVEGHYVCVCVLCIMLIGLCCFYMRLLLMCACVCLLLWVLFLIFPSPPTGGVIDVLYLDLVSVDILGSLILCDGNLI